MCSTDDPVRFARFRRPCLVLSWCVQAPAKVVDEVRANLQAQKDQLKTVQQAIADLDL